MNRRKYRLAAAFAAAIMIFPRKLPAVRADAVPVFRDHRDV